MLASGAMREHHATWHHVRDRWHALSGAERQQFIDAGWQPPRINPVRMSPDEPPAPAPDPGAGVDFLFMHRRMIQRVDEALAVAADPAYARVEGWRPVPWDHADADWPMPTDWGQGDWAKDLRTTETWRTAVAEQFENDHWLRSISIDAMGTEIERGMHVWMHLHWAAAPWFRGLPGQDPDDSRNDFLASTYSSHVNKAFWKLHGWIDDRIGQWERANGRSADLSAGWEGPSHMHHRIPHAAPRRILTDAQRAEAETFFARLIPEGALAHH